jgi:hypothetical protein
MQQSRGMFGPHGGDILSSDTTLLRISRYNIYDSYRR